jgi:hypothetical protein
MIDVLPTEAFPRKTTLKRGPVAGGEGEEADSSMRNFLSDQRLKPLKKLSDNSVGIGRPVTMGADQRATF